MTKLVIVRHGESTWNKENRFTGWTDVDLTPRGAAEAREAGRLLVAEGLAAEIPGPHARFDANMEAHHHFTCLRCGRILDVDGPLAEPHAEALRGRIAARTGFAITHHRIEFFGRCPQCRSAKARPRRAP